MTTELEIRNKAIVKRWIDEVFNSGTLASVDELKVSSYLDWTPLPSPYQDVQLPVSGIKAALPEWLEGLPDFTFSADEMIADGDFVACMGRWEAHHRGDYKGHSPTGRRVGGTRIDIFRVAGDRMVEHWGCGNELAFMQLVGALGSDGERGEAGDEGVARGFVETVLGDRNLAALADLVDPRAIDHSGEALSMLSLLSAFSDVEIEVTDVTADGDEFTVTSTVRGTHTGPFHGIAATGKSVVATRVDRFRIADGKVAELWRDSDDSTLVEQLAG